MMPDILVQDFLSFDDARLYALLHVMIYLPNYTVRVEEYPGTIVWVLNLKVHKIEGRAITTKVLNDCAAIVFSKNVIGWRLVAPSPVNIKREINKYLNGDEYALGYTG